MEDLMNALLDPTTPYGALLYYATFFAVVGFIKWVSDHL